MKILLAHPGAGISTADVHNGLVDAFRRRQDVELMVYPLEDMILKAGAWLRHLWKTGPEGRGKPTAADTLYQAGLPIIERALRYDVDWVFIVSAMYFHPDLIIMMRRAGFKIACLFTESPYDDDRQVRLAPYIDIGWVNERTSVDKFREIHPNFHYLAHAFRPDLHRPGPGDTDIPAHDVVFVGTGFIERIRMLEAVNWDGIDLGIYGGWNLLGSRHRLRRYVNGGATGYEGIDNTQAVELYRRAKIGINLYRTSSGFGRDAHHVHGAESLSPRAYELAACGLFHLSQWRRELTEKFGKVVPTFRTAEDLEGLIRHYLAHEEERKSIAAQLPALVAGETFDARVATIIEGLRTTQGVTEATVESERELAGVS